MSDIDAVALTQQLVRFDTRNPPGDEQACAEFLANLLRGNGFTVELHAFGEQRANVIARRGDEPRKALTGHIDVVPLGTAAWTHDPFGAEIVDGKLYGRGACDMKAGVAAMIAAAVAEPDSAVSLYLTGGEETGSHGARALADAGLLDEAELLVVGEPTANQFLAGHKGALWLHACCHGVTAHGSTPHLGDNAIYKAARGISALKQFGFNVPPHAVMGSPTLNIGTMQAGQNVNSVPDRAEFTVDIRTVPGMSHDRLHDELGFTLGADADLGTLVDLPPVWSDPASATMRRMADAYASALGRSVAPASANYFTDASVLTPAMGNLPTIILGPGDPAMAHKTDEYCEVAAITDAVAIYRAIIGGR